MQILSIMPPRFLHSKEYHDYPNATMSVIDASAFPMPAGAQIGRSSKFHHIRHQKSACFTRSSQSKKTAVSIYTTKVRETWLKTNKTLDTGTVILYIVSSPIVFLPPDNHILWILPTSQPQPTGLSPVYKSPQYDICQVLKGVQISSV